MSDNEVQSTREYIRGFEDGYEFILEHMKTDSVELKERLDGELIDFSLLESVFSFALQAAKFRKINMLLDGVTTTIEAHK